MQIISSGACPKRLIRHKRCGLFFLGWVRIRQLEAEREQLALGQTIKKISAELGIRVKTVSSHLESLYRKLEVQSQLGAVGKALCAGII
jgi:DNA-binding CsgD family transcriptional regulator